jgi:hypothetical protein
MPALHLHVQSNTLKMINTLQLITMYATKTPDRTSHAQHSEIVANTNSNSNDMRFVFDARKSRQDMDSQFNTEITPHASYIILVHPEPA